MTPTHRRVANRDVLLAVLLLLLAGYSIISGVQSKDDADQARHELHMQQVCISRFIASQSSTTDVRSAANDQESQATREIITAVLTARDKDGTSGITPATRLAIQRAYRKWQATLAKVDQERADNPPKVFDDQSCEESK